MVENIALLSIIFFMISMAYSSVGLGGGSTYLIVLYLSGLPILIIPPVVLLVNVVVSATAWYRFRSSRFFRFKLILPFTLSSIPAAFLGARFRLNESSLTILLAILLLLVSMRMILMNSGIRTRTTLSWKQSWVIGLPCGALLGLLAGVIGIGGGIFLGPILIFYGLANAKEAAGACSFFVLFNSASGLISHISKNGVDLTDFLPLIIAAFIGGIIGSYFGAKKLSPLLLQRVLGLILLIVSIKIFAETIF